MGRKNEVTGPIKKMVVRKPLIEIALIIIYFLLLNLNFLNFETTKVRNPD